MTELLAGLPAAGNYTIQVDRLQRTKVKLIAPHAGCIEPATGQIVRSLAEGKFDSYLFSGIRRKDCFRTLHVTSIRYDEPHALRFARDSDLAVAVHGCNGEESYLQIGGGNRERSEGLAAYLDGLGYTIRKESNDLNGEHPDNIVNLARQQGIQMELSAGFRRELFPGFPRTLQRHPVQFPRFIEALSKWLDETELSLSAQPL